ncbi:MAG: HD domain-containing protein [Deltaproteobacteria bacterium]|nr:HD domain-containing protein [Deltaproteobacteria bacterium]
MGTNSLALENSKGASFELARIKIQMGSVTLMGTEVTQKGIFCLSAVNISQHISKSAYLNCTPDGGKSISLVATIVNCVPKNLSFLVELQFDEAAFYKFLNLKPLAPAVAATKTSARTTRSGGRTSILKPALKTVAAAPKSEALPVDPAKLEYYKVPIDVFAVGEKVEMDVYFYYQRQYVLFKSKNSVWASADDLKLANTQIDTLYVHLPSSAEHDKFLHSRLKMILERPNISLERKGKVLYEIADPILSKVFKTPSSEELLSSAGTFAKSCIQYLNSQGGLRELLKLSSENLTEHAHALHCSTYAIALAKELGHKDQTQLFHVAMGGLLHDIGKSKIDSKIIEKTKELTEEEWLLVRQHPNFGYDIVKDRSGVPELSKKIILEHHERVNGKGYPNGRKTLHVFSRVTAIVDAFNSITSERSFAKSKPPFVALKYMLETMREELDKTILVKFIDMLSK